MPQRGIAFKFLIVAGVLLGVMVISAAITPAVLMADNKILTWTKYDDKSLVKDLSSGRPVVLDFWAPWCEACQKLEISVFSDPRVEKALGDFILVRVDMTDPFSSRSRWLMKKYHLAGMPTIIFFDRKGKECRESRMQGAVSVEDFLKNIQQATQSE